MASKKLLGIHLFLMFVILAPISPGTGVAFVYSAFVGVIKSVRITVPLRYIVRKKAHHRKGRPVSAVPLRRDNKGGERRLFHLLAFSPGRKYKSPKPDSPLF